MSEQLSRRSFLAGAGAAAVAVGASGTAVASEANGAFWLPEKWDREADVVVIGFGGAGAVAAITAHDEGAEVLVLEKAPIEGGGASRMSGAGITYVEPEHVKDAAQYIYDACQGATPLDVLEGFCESMTHVPDWLLDHGYDVSFRDGYSTGDFPGVPNASGNFRGIATAGNGLAFFNRSTEICAELGIEILFDCPATDLIQNPITKEIIGVYANQSGTRIAVKARRGVCLTCGGFEFNEEMQINYLKTIMKCVGWKYNTGDGIKMAQRVGADLWHMNQASGTQTTTITPNTEIGWLGVKALGGSHIWVTRKGKRFICEYPFPVNIHRSDLVLNLWDTDEANITDTRLLTSSFYLIFDEKCRLAGPIGKAPVRRSAFTVPPELGGLTDDEMWSDDNSREIEAGWIKKADSIEELAKVIGDIDGEALAETVTRWNEMCANGVDEDFGRYDGAPAAMGWSPLDPNLVPIDTPPYYCLEIWPAMYHTHGGPRKNGKAQVLDVDRNPIPRLYEAGSCGSTVGYVYTFGGHNWAEVTAFGRLAGLGAAGEEPWE
ncbi:MAG: FAD-binding protein [Coriobacteriales bacterium]|nr:FAD-binding protein [Coriobacteriales bacterium]